MNRLRIFANNLFAHEMLHLLSGILMFFLILRMFGQLKFAFLAFLVSLLIDVDHYFEGLFVNRLKFDWVFTTYPHVF